MQLDFREPLPDSELESRAWQESERPGFVFKTSAWILPGLLTVGILTWACYAYTGFRANNSRWKLTALAWFVPGGMLVALLAMGSAGNDLMTNIGVGLLLVLVFCTAIAWKISNPSWLVASARRKIWREAGRA